MSKFEADGRNPDPRTAELLRALQRARGMAVSPLPLTSAPVGARVPDPPARSEAPSDGGTAARQALESLLSSTRALERALAIAIERLAEVQRGQDRAARELSESAKRFEEAADALAGWWAWAGRRVAAWGLVLGLLTAAAAALSWRAHAVTATTQAILEQILENQARAQAANGGKRR